MTYGHNLLHWIRVSPYLLHGIIGALHTLDTVVKLDEIV